MQKKKSKKYVNNSQMTRATQNFNVEEFMALSRSELGIICKQ